MVSSALSSGSAYAVLSSATPLLIGHFAKYTRHDTAITGRLVLGGSLTVDASTMGFDDDDGDAEDVSARTYAWFIDGVQQSSTETLNIPKDNTLSGKQVVLHVTPTTLTGDPTVGITYVIGNLLDAGATDGGNGGSIAPDLSAQPIVSDLTLTGTIQVKQTLAATYTWNANGGHPTDKSTYTWRRGIAGTSLATGTVTASETVDGYTLVPADAGEVMELSLTAVNGAPTAVTGNTVTINSQGGATDTSGGTGGGTDNTVDSSTPGSTPGLVGLAPSVDPQSVAIEFTSTATLAANGIDGIRPVAARDQMTARLTTEPGTVADVANYTYTWYANGVAIPEAVFDGVPTYTPGVTYQGQAIAVDVTVKP